MPVMSAHRNLTATLKKKRDVWTRAARLALSQYSMKTLQTSSSRDLSTLEDITPSPDGMRGVEVEVEVPVGEEPSSDYLMGAGNNEAKRQGTRRVI